MRWGWAVLVVMAACGGATPSSGARASTSDHGGDSDGDGILDDKDACPRDPEDFDGYYDEDGCPDPDNDRDGVPDVSDKCSNVAAGSRPDPKQPGCPLITRGPGDRDGDGIADAADKCPDEAEDYDGFQDADGCDDPDNDDDGAIDFEDLCPNQAAGPTPSAKRHGCPAAAGEAVGRPIQKPARAPCNANDHYGYTYSDCSDPKKK